MAARITLGSLPGREFPAKVVEISRQPSANTTYPVTLALVGDADPALRSGMDGEAALTLPEERGGSIAIPIECVVGRGTTEQFVWVVDGSEDSRKVARRAVVTGDLSPGGKIQIRDGLQPGEVVVAQEHRLARMALG